MEPGPGQSPSMLRVEHRGPVTWLVGDHPPVNALSQPVRQGLLDGLRHPGDGAQAIVLAARGRTFYAGADIDELDRGLRSPGLLELVVAGDRSPLPVVAALHGSVYGGGVVVACAADRRLAAEGTRFAMPELSLGLLPTFGGTVFLVRWLGVEAALSLIVDGAVWSADEALRSGLIDEIVPAAELDERAQALAEERPAKRRVRDASCRVAEDAATVADAFARRRRHGSAHAPDFEAATAVLDLMERGLGLPMEAALVDEHRVFLQLLASPQSRRLRRLFFAERRLRRSHLDVPSIAARIAACGPEPVALQALARELLAQNAVPDAEWLDALIVATLGLPRHRPSLIDPLPGHLP